MNKTVLVVEDNDLLMMMYRSALGELGATLLYADSGEEAIDVAAGEHPDLVIMDIVLPGKSGVEAACDIRMLPGLEDVPIIAVTVHDDPSEIDGFDDAGFDGYLTKPVNLDEFLDLVRTFIGQ